jgi:SAM-dependent methyltransferase
MRYWRGLYFQASDLLSGLLGGRTLDAEGFVRRAYLVLLGREGDDAGVAHFGGKPRHQAVMEIMASPEYRHRLLTRKAGRSSLEAHHQARCDLIQRFLPPAKRILDLGGGCSFSDAGALLALGYPHEPELVTIIDFPPGDRVESSHSGLREESHLEGGTEVVFRYGSFTELGDIQSGAYDLVWSGQTIEHITEAEADHVAAEVYRVLSPGGRFCLDTPNRAVTRLMTEEFIHPEHKIEYTPQDLVQGITRHGFNLQRALSVSPMPKSLRAGRFSMEEAVASTSVGGNADEGFSFYLELSKP